MKIFKAIIIWDSHYPVQISIDQVMWKELRSHNNYLEIIFNLTQMKNL